MWDSQASGLSRRALQMRQRHGYELGGILLSKISFWRSSGKAGALGNWNDCWLLFSRKFVDRIQAKLANWMSWFVVNLGRILSMFILASIRRLATSFVVGWYVSGRVGLESWSQVVALELFVAVVVVVVAEGLLLIKLLLFCCGSYRAGWFRCDIYRGGLYLFGGFECGIYLFSYWRLKRIWDDHFNFGHFAHCHKGSGELRKDLRFRSLDHFGHCIIVHQFNHWEAENHFTVVK